MHIRLKPIPKEDSLRRLLVFGSCERHSKLTEEMHIRLKPIPKEDSLCR